MVVRDLYSKLGYSMIRTSDEEMEWEYKLHDKHDIKVAFIKKMI